MPTAFHAPLCFRRQAGHQIASVVIRCWGLCQHISWLESHTIIITFVYTVDIVLFATLVYCFLPLIIRQIHFNLLFYARIAVIVSLKWKHSRRTRGLPLLSCCLLTSRNWRSCWWISRPDTKFHTWKSRCGRWPIAHMMRCCRYPHQAQSIHQIVLLGKAVQAIHAWMARVDD